MTRRVRSNQRARPQPLWPRAGSVQTVRRTTARYPSCVCGLENLRDPRPATVICMQEPLDHWFAREILVHEEALVRYLRRAWRWREDIHDLRQDVYVRVYEAAGRLRPCSPKAFLFTTARHLMTDRLLRRRIVSIEAVGDLNALDVLVDVISPERVLDGRQMLNRLADAFDQLPERCRQVAWLRKVEELSQKEIAQRLCISEKTVEKQIAKGARLLADHFHGGTRAVPGAPSLSRNERDHG